MKTDQPPRTSALKVGALTVIAILLTTAGMSRLGLGLTAALAEIDMTRAASTAADPDALDLLTTLRAREAELNTKEATLDARMAELAEGEARLTRLLAELTDAEHALEQTMALTQTAAEDDVTRLTAVYENMKPESAAVLFEEMEPGFAAGFIARLRPDVAAQILAGLPPRSAYAISAILAGRNALVPTD